MSRRWLGHSLIVRDEVDSTSTLARNLAEEGAEHGTAVCARRQTAGRGRRGRTWASLSGDHVYLSVVLRPRLPPDRVPELTLVAAVAVAEALAQFGVDARIKWPNDVLSHGRKLSGILSELTADASGQIRFVVLGIGVNVSAPAEGFPDELKEIATSVEREVGRAVDAGAVTTAVLDRLEAWIDVHERGMTEVLNAWRARSATIGQQVRVIADGHELVGLAEDVDGTGALLVRSGDQLHRVIAGEAVHVRSA